MKSIRLVIALRSRCWSTDLCSNSEIEGLRHSSIAPALSLRVYAAILSGLDVTTLGEDPRTTNHLNGEAFQQDALVTFNVEYHIETRR